jgi:hypothetical protein
MQRWGEEVLLLQEEMHWVLIFCEYHAAWWDDHVSLCSGDLFLDLQDGVHAYATKQADIHCWRAKAFNLMWGSPGVEPDLDIGDCDDQ